jgi:mono/diheme cytochrome c family protein
MKIVVILALAAITSACSSTQTPAASETPGHTARSNIRSTVAATPESIASGQKLYDRLCANCHGSAGDGISELAANLQAGEPKPSDLTDDQWDFGSTDADIFVGIRDGVGVGAMKGLNGRPGIGEREMWHVVNYVRSLRR